MCLFQSCDLSINVYINCEILQHQTRLTAGFSLIWACYATLLQALRSLVCVPHLSITPRWGGPGINTLCFHTPFYVGSNSNAVSSQQEPKPTSQCRRRHFPRNISKMASKIKEFLCYRIMSIRTGCNTFTPKLKHRHTLAARKKYKRPNANKLQLYFSCPLWQKNMVTVKLYSFMYSQIENSKILHSVHLCVLQERRTNSCYGRTTRSQYRSAASCTDRLKIKKFCVQCNCLFCMNLCFSLLHGYQPNPATPKLQDTSKQEHTTNVVIQQKSRRLLMMDILMSEPC